MRSISLFLNSPKNMEIPLGTLLHGFQITEVRIVEKPLQENMLTSKRNCPNNLTSTIKWF